MRRPNAKSAVSGRSDVGATSELLVCADLLGRGFEVFRAVSPSTSCDLIALKHGRCVRIQVRTAKLYHRKDGSERLHFGRGGNHDVVAAVVYSHSRHEITYEPLLDSD